MESLPPIIITIAMNSANAETHIHPADTQLLLALLAEKERELLLLREMVSILKRKTP
jgi:hypothetical protein